MARVIVRETGMGKKYFDGNMYFKDVEDMVKKVGKVDGRICVSKSTKNYTFGHNMHHIDFYKNGIDYDIHLTGKQFEKMKSIFEEMGEVKIDEYFWFGRT